MKIRSIACIQPDYAISPLNHRPIAINGRLETTFQKFRMPKHALAGKIVIGLVLRNRRQQLPCERCGHQPRKE